MRELERRPVGGLDPGHAGLGVARDLPPRRPVAHHALGPRHRHHVGRGGVGLGVGGQARAARARRRSSRSPARSRGSGHRHGQSFAATATRIRCPGRNLQPVAIRSSSTAASPSQARLTAPRVTGCDSPPGATSFSLTDTIARGPGWAIRKRTRGCPAPPPARSAARCRSRRCGPRRCAGPRTGRCRAAAGTSCPWPGRPSPRRPRSAPTPASAPSRRQIPATTRSRSTRPTPAPAPAAGESCSSMNTTDRGRPAAPASAEPGSRWVRKNWISSRMNGIHRPGHAAVGRDVRPRPGQELPWAPQPLGHPQARRAVAVVPARDDEDGALDPLVVRPQRPVAPVRAVVLLGQPAHHPRRGRVDPLPPAAVELGPLALARRKRVHADHADRVVAELERGHRAAVEVHVVGEPVVGCVHRRDRAQRGRPAGGELDAREAAVGLAPASPRCRCTTPGARSSRPPRRRRAARPRCTRPPPHPRSCPCRARPAARRRTRPRPARCSGRDPAARAGRPCGRGCARGSRRTGPGGRAGRRRPTGARRRACECGRRARARSARRPIPDASHAPAWDPLLPAALGERRPVGLDAQPQVDQERVGRRPKPRLGMHVGLEPGSLQVVAPVAPDASR